jgi:hypothetical protein
VYWIGCLWKSKLYLWIGRRAHYVSLVALAGRVLQVLSLRLELKTSHLEVCFGRTECLGRKGLAIESLETHSLEHLVSFVLQVRRHHLVIGRMDSCVST